MEDSDDKVRWMVASKRKATRAMLDKLATDEHESVRLAVASNRSTPRAVLEKLTNDSWERVVRSGAATARLTGLIHAG